jgi:hypothetical protein
MSFRIIQLEELEVSVKENNKNISLLFEDAFIKKTMDDAEEKTLWKQSGSIEMNGVFQKEGDFDSKLKIISIDVSYDFYTYRNILILPFIKKGDIELELKHTKGLLNINCNEIEILLIDQPKYIKHINKKE